MEKPLQLFLCFLVWIFFLIPVLFLPTILLVCLYFYRKIIDGVVTGWLHPTWKPILPPDSVFAHGTHKRFPTQHGKQERCFGNSAFLALFHERIPLEEFRERFKARLSLWKPGSIAWNAEDLKDVGRTFDTFSMTPVKCIGYYYWAPSFIDVSKQIWEYDCHKAGSEEFDDFLGNWVASAFEGQAIFEAVLASPPSGNFAGQTVLAIKYNHVLGDGMSLIHCLYEAMFGASRSPQYLNLPVVKMSWGQVLYQILVFPRVLYQFSRHNGVPNLSEFLYKDTPTPPEGWKTIHSTSSIPLSSVKLIKRSLGIPFREVLACTFMSALRKLVLQEGPINSKLPDNVSCLIAMPWVFSPRSTDNLFSNHATSSLFLYPMKLGNPLERMKKASQVSRQNLLDGMNRVMYYATYLTYILPACLADSKLFNQISLTMNSVDVVAKRDPEELYLDRYRAYPTLFGTMALHPVGQLYGTDLVSVFVSNEARNEVSVTLTANSKLIRTRERGQLLCKYFQLEMEELVEIVQRKQKSGEDKDTKKYGFTDETRDSVV